DVRLTGLEIELNLVDSAWRPAMANAEVLQAIADPAFQTELARYNIELNVPPQPLPGDAVLDLERQLRASMNEAESKAARYEAGIVMIGVLPTLRTEDLAGDWMSANERYRALEAAIF